LQLRNLIFEEMTSDMEDFDTLFIVSLECNPGEKHMSHLSESKCCMRIDEIYFGWCDIDIPLRKVGAHEYKQIDDV
jgi:hypothetical protein